MFVTSNVYLNIMFLHIACGFELLHNPFNFKSINMQSSITDNINIELDKICDWLAVNKLSLNGSKSNYMIFHHRQNKLKSTSIPILEMNHTLIKQVNEFTFSGLTIIWIGTRTSPTYQTK